MKLKQLPARPRLDRYRREALDLIKSLESGSREATEWIRRHHPNLPGRPDTNDRNVITDAEAQSVKLSVADARLVIARRHQFESWPAFANHIAALNRKGSPVAQFEAAADAIVTGDAATLKRLLGENSELIRARSTREHRATLLHYVGANAVEAYRQKTPRNAVKIAEILLKAGAEVDADLDYGPMRERYPERTGSTTLGMVATSCHPAIAGVQIPLLEVLLKHGASVDGIPGAWSPLIAALHNGRGDAARFLAERGARVDLEGAAGTGQLDAVKTFFNKNGTLKAGATKRQMELGFAWASEYGHISVVRFLLDTGMDAGAMPHGETGLHWAAYGGHADIVKLLLKRGAPVDLKDCRFNGSPLGWALHGWTNPSPESNRGGYYDAVGQLVAAGAKVEKEWLTDRGFPMARKIRSDRKMLAALGDREKKKLK